MKRSNILAALAPIGVALILVSPRVAQACSVCSAGRDDETRTAFLATTALLTFLPLGLVGGIVWWLWRRARELAEAELLEPGGDAPRG